MSYARLPRKTKKAALKASAARKFRRLRLGRREWIRLDQCSAWIQRHGHDPTRHPIPW